MNRALKLVSTFAFLSLAACGGNSEVTVNGQTLKPKSAEFFSGPIAAELPIPVTMVMVHDVEGLCKAFGTVDACTGSVDPTIAGVSNATMLVIFKIGSSEGESTVGTSGFAAAGLQFMAVRNGQTVVSDEAISGTITFDDLEPGSGASGSYDVTMKSGAKISGTFDADHCDGLAQMFGGLMGSEGPECAPTFSDSLSCSTSCSCEQKSNSVSCSRNSIDEDWSCSCDVRGQKTTCTVSKDEVGACISPDQGGRGCCPDPFEF